MHNAILANATVTSDDFKDAALAGANLTGVDLSAATLDGVSSGGISDSQAPSAVPAGWRFTIGYLVGATAHLGGANLTGGDISNMNLAGLNLKSANLTDATVSGTDLSGGSLWMAKLTGADLANATVTNVNLQQAVLTGANLSGVDLSTATLLAARSGGISAADAPAVLPPNWKFIGGYLVGRYADLGNANLTGADLSGMDLAYTTMNGANFADTDLAGAKMALTYLSAVRSGGITGQPASLPAGFTVKYGFIFGDGVNLHGANLSGLDLGGLTISDATLTDANLAKAGLTGTNLTGSDLRGADLLGAIFGGTSLFQANLTGDNLTGVSLANSNLTLAALRHANLTDSSLRAANLTGADLTGAVLTGLRSGGITGLPSHLPGNWSSFYGYLLGPRANLAGASLHGDFLFNVDLAGANLTKANLSGANVRSSELAGTQLNYASFADADLTGAELNATDAYLKGVTWTGAICPNGGKAGTQGCFPSNSGPQRVPQVSPSPRVGVPASAMQVTGAGFTAGIKVSIYFGPVYRTAVTTSSTGRFGPLTITVPKDAQPGLHKITAKASASGQSASAWFTMQASWAQAQFAPSLDGFNSNENTLSPANAGSLQTKWTFSPGASEAFTPAIADGIAYVTTYNGHMYALNATTGQQDWTWTFPDSSLQTQLTAPAVAGHVAFVGSSYGNLYAIGPGGHQEWKFSTASSAPTVQGRVVYVTGGDVNALNASSGLPLWSVDPAARTGCNSQPAVDGAVVYASCGDGALYALSAATGATLWSYSNSGNDLNAPAVANGVVYVGDTNADTVHAISTTTHTQLWSYTTGARIDTTPAVANGLVYVSTFDGSIYALDAATGAKTWSFDLGGTVPSAISPAVANGVVYVTSSNEVVYALDARTGAKLWSYSHGNTLQSGPVVANGRVYVGTGDGGLHAFGLG